IHVAIVVGGYDASRDVITLIKSVLFYRNHPLHFHFIADPSAQNILSKHFFTWQLHHVDISFYNLQSIKKEIAWIPNRHYSGIYGLMKLILITILPNSLKRVIVLDTDLTFNADIADLWYYFRYLTKDKILGLVENQSDWYLGKLWKNHTPWPALGRGFNTGVMLINLSKLRQNNWNYIWKEVTEKQLKTLTYTTLADQDIINAVIKSYPKLVYRLPCSWNIQLSDNTRSQTCYKKSSEIKIIHWNSPKKINVRNKHIQYFRNIYQTFIELDGNLLRRELIGCEKSNLKPTSVRTRNMHVQLKIVSNDNLCDPCYQFRVEAYISHRIHPYLLDYKYQPNDNYDVTLVTHLSIDRLQMLDGLAKHWTGPMSIALYVTDRDVPSIRSFIQHSNNLSNRKNIGYHIVYIQGDCYPVNKLRNIALDYITTDYVFLLDIDFLPSHNSYQYLRYYFDFLSLQHNFNKAALIVPAFETQRYRVNFPESKERLIALLNKQELFTFRYHLYTKAHSPTNYTKWQTANETYQVQWQENFEPYIVVTKNVARYDERFIGFGWNKVSHIMELHARGYRFLVLPNVFIIHMPHSPSRDITKFRSSKVYRSCLKRIKEEFKSELLKNFPHIKT
ncbi:uncharacterized protein TRIADDRAFT_32796, partial [Trichoplax adhaerens]